jgi:hypothetical protein
VFGITRDDIAAPVKIAGYTHPSFMSPYGSHFEEVDMLGTDFMTNYNVVMWPDWDTQKVAFLFGRDWNLVRKNLK